MKYTNEEIRISLKMATFCANMNIKEMGNMSNANDIFNLDKTDDLPENFKKELKLLNIRDDTRHLLDLFERKNKLSIDEILIGLYRLHKIIKTRIWVSSTLYNLSRKNLIRKVAGTKGQYEKC